MEKSCTCTRALSNNHFGRTKCWWCESVAAVYCEKCNDRWSPNYFTIFSPWHPSRCHWKTTWRSSGTSTRDQLHCNFTAEKERERKGMKRKLNISLIWMHVRISDLIGLIQRLTLTSIDDGKWRNGKEKLSHGSDLALIKNANEHFADSDPWRRAIGCSNSIIATSDRSVKLVEMAEEHDRRERVTLLIRNGWWGTRSTLLLNYSLLDKLSIKIFSWFCLVLLQTQTQSVSH